jgi:hypothetical protein
MNIPESLVEAFEHKSAWDRGVEDTPYFYGMLDMFCEMRNIDVEAVYEELNDIAQARAETLAQTED